MSELYPKITLRKQVQDILKKEISEKYQPGAFLPGEKLLAQRFQVSVLTVREAVQGLVDLKLVERRQGVGTVVLSQTERRMTLPVGILVEIDVTHPNTSPFYLTLAMALKNELEKRGHGVRLFLGSLPPGAVSDRPLCPEFDQTLEKGAIKALISLSATSMGWRSELEEKGIPVLSLGNTNPWGVRIDQGKFIQDALADLIARGCRRLALITWDGRSSRNASERSELFKDLVERAGLAAHGSWIFAGVEPALGGAGWEALREVWSAESERPDGVIVTDEMLLRGALLAIHELRIPVPEKLAIAALVVPQHTNTGLIPVTLYETPVDEIVLQMTDLVEARLTNSDTPPRIVSIPAKKVPDETLSPDTPSSKRDGNLTLAET